MTSTNRRRLATGITLSILVSLGWAQAASARQADGPSAERSRPITNATRGVSVEAQDAALAVALLSVVRAPTSDNLAAVAERYYHLGIRDKAMDYFAESLRRNANSVRALDGSARIWRDWGQMNQALGTAHRARYFAPQSAPVWNTLGTILQALDQNAAAADAYRQAVALDSSAVYARSNLCYLAFVQGDAERSIAECTAALNVDGEFAPARNNLALAYAAAGDTQRATDTVRGLPEEADVHYNLGIVLLARREYAGAVLAFEAAYRVDPSFDAAHARAREARRLARRHMETADANR